jgi:antirestriction protein ArdC
LGLSNEPRPDHAQYIGSWLKVLKSDKRAIFTAASKAQQATDFMIQQSGRIVEVAA